MRQQNRMRVFIGFSCFVILFSVCGVGAGQDWPSYRCDITRSGISSESIGPELFLEWKYAPLHRPKTAWLEPAEERARMHSDRAYHVTAAGDSLYFGSSVTNEVYSLDAGSGKIRWTFFAEGPVRFAPAVYKSRVYFGSDDGYVYCLDADKGKLIWKYRAGPSDEKVIGNGAMISLWPVRTGVLVDGGVVYFGAGVFPYEGIYICALGAEDGEVVWKNDTIGYHEHELAYGGISPHGYPLASKDILYVPSGRSMPAAFDRKTGEFLFYPRLGHKRGGTWALLDAGELIAGVDTTYTQSGGPAKAAYDPKTGEFKRNVFGWFGGIDIVVNAGVAYTLTEEGVYAIDREAHSDAVEKAAELAQGRRKLASELSDLRKKLKESNEQLRGEEIDQQIDEMTGKISELVATEDKRLKESSYKWHYRSEGLASVIMAGDYLFAGGEGVVIGIDARNGKELWKAKISGKAVGLAAANGRLIVSTEEGPIYCFGEEKVSRPKEIKTAVGPLVYPDDKVAGLYKSAAEEIIKEAQIKKGYCLVLDCGEGRLAYELAKRTEMKIVGIEKDAEKLAIARKNLKAAGLLGSRVVVEAWDVSSLPMYFANLIVSDGMLISGKTAVSNEQIGRVLRPYGGVSLLGTRRAGTEKVSFNKFVRGKLEGAGVWTHQYGNPQNTASSRDELVKGPLGVLWFGEPGPKGMVERHAKAASPLSRDGRLFIQGEEIVMAYDAYNGTFLWERKIPGAFRVRVDVDSGNLALTQDGFYVAAYDKCYKLDPATGETIRTYRMPASDDGGKRRWGYLACVDGIVYGSAATPLKREYAALWKKLIKDGKWIDEEAIKSQSYEDNSFDEGLDYIIEYKTAYDKYASDYPVPNQGAREAMQRSGALWHPIADFPKWENYSSAKEAVTERIMVSDKIFALDGQSGNLLWEHNGKRIANVTLSLGDGKIFFAESGISEQQKKRALEDRQRLIDKGIYEQAEDPNIAYEDADVRSVVCLDAVSGKKVWEKTLDLTGCCGDALGTIYYDGVLLLCGNVGNHDAWRFRDGELKFRRITAVSARDGEVLWSKPLNYRTRPLIVGGEIIVEPRACDLRSGDIKMRKHPVTGEDVEWEFLRPGHTCAVTSASADVLFYRSSCTAFYDMAGDKGLTIFGGIRPGCWINAIPANGLMLMPEASSGCTCSYPLRGSFAMVHKPKRVEPWTVLITGGQMRPVKHLAVNFGAPADMRDADGTLWFGYPNPETEYLKNHFPGYGVKFDCAEEIVDGGGYFCRDYKGVDIQGSDKAWLFTSGCQGLLRCELPLIDDVNAPNPGTYTVQLGFNAPAEDKIGQRVFNIKLQGKIAVENFDILKTAGKVNKAVIREFKGIDVKNTLTLELVPRNAHPQINQMPLINFIRVIREGT